MSASWSLELLRLIILIASAVITGYAIDSFVLSLSIHFFLYIVWIFIQVASLERWISRGANRTDAPDNSGIWQSIVQHLSRSQRSHKARKKQLASLANYYQAVMRALPNATVVVNNKLEIEWANKASESLLGIRPQMDVGQRIDNIIRNPEIEQLFELDAVSTRIQVESPVNSELTLSITLQEYAEGSYLLIASDISHRIATQKLRKAFIANASHELRTPLTVILGYLEILADDELPKELQKIINNAYAQASRMDTLLDNLLVLSKIEGRKHQKSTGERVDVQSLLDRLVADFKVSAASGAHKFIIEAEAIDLKVIESEFYSICQNLVSNAIKYSAAGSTITIKWRLDEAGFGCLSVTDQGDGIPQEHINRLTERFYRVNNSSSKAAGTGLGLSIVKHILENYDGYLEILSTVGEGSTFKACFPSYRIKTTKKA